MKQFNCGDVVAGCNATFVYATDEQILGAVAEHARADHGLTVVPPSLVSAVQSHIRAA